MILYNHADFEDHMENIGLIVVSMLKYAARDRQRSDTAGTYHLRETKFMPKPTLEDVRVAGRGSVIRAPENP